MHCLLRVVVGVVAGVAAASCSEGTLPSAASVRPPDAAPAAAPKRPDAAVPDAAPPPSYGEPMPGGRARPAVLGRGLAEALRLHGPPLGRVRHTRPDGAPRYVNRLVRERSPYLRERAFDPVDWLPWGPEAFERASIFDQPILVVIGHGGCVACRRLSELAFESEEMARKINERLVAVHVDRDARPDVAALYRESRARHFEGDDWPILLWLTPQGQPLLAVGDRDPAEAERLGKPTFGRILDLMDHAWRTDRADQLEAAKGRAESLSRLPEGPGGGGARGALRALSEIFDGEHGGFGTPPRDVPFAALELLLETGGAGPARDQARATLDAVAAGAVRDPLDGGLFTGADDAAWHLPSFDKSLIANARATRLFLDAAATLDAPAYLDVAAGCLAFIDGALSDPAGGFLARLLPYSDDGLGNFYAWSPAEVDAAVGADAALARAAWGIGPRGVFNRGRSIPRAARTVAELAVDTGRPEAEVHDALTRARAAALEARARRPPPWRDPRVFVDANGLAISAFARAGARLGREDLVARAVRAAEAVLRGARHGEVLTHVVGGPADAAAEGYLDDYVLLAGGLLELAEATGDARWLDESRALMARVDTVFGHPGGAWVHVSEGSEHLIARSIPWTDGVRPSLLASQIANLERLSALTADPAPAARAARARAAAASALSDEGPRVLDTLSLRIPPRTRWRGVVLVAAAPADVGPAAGPADPAAPTFAEVTRAAAGPRTMVVRAAWAAGPAAAPAWAGWAAGCAASRDGSASACVCEGGRCRPFATPALLAKALLANALSAGGR